MLVVNLNLARRMLKPNYCSVEILYSPQARGRKYHQNRGDTEYIYWKFNNNNNNKKLNMLF